MRFLVGTICSQYPYLVNKLLAISVPRLDQIHDHDVTIAEREMISVTRLLYAFDLRQILKKYGRKLIQTVIDDT